jgi:hypothetical protein
MLTFHSLLGIKIVRKRPLLIVASEVYKVLTLGSSAIYEIKNVNWIAVAPPEFQ